VTGFDDIELAQFCQPALTTVHIPRDEIGHTVFDSLAPTGNIRHMPGREVSITPELVVRDSCGPARRTDLIL
jgi:DNA-binding LacI/PurR family transcriptional regulator